jgi:hypothetical protein
MDFLGKSYDYSLAQFRHPFSCLIGGPSGSGKTQFLTNCLLNCETTINAPVQRLVYCYGTELPETFRVLKRKFPFMEMYKGLVDLKFNPRIANFVILDDLMTDAYGSVEVANYFSRGCHHLNLSVFMLTQNIFQQDKYARTISTNANYIVYFKNPRDNVTITNLSKQVFPGRINVLVKSFNDSTAQAHGYLVMDFKQDIDNKFRLKTYLLPTDTLPPLFMIPDYLVKNE